MRPDRAVLGRARLGLAAATLAIATSCRPPLRDGAALPAAAAYDVLIEGGAIYDGTGAPPRVADLAIRGDAVVAVGALRGAKAATTVDARGLAVAPGFVNMLSNAHESLLVDGRAASDVRQGVTLEVMGEGWSMGPLAPAVKRSLAAEQSDLRYDVTWTSLGEYLEALERRGVAPNVASFVGAATLRMDVMGESPRAPSPDEMRAMERLAAEAMREGALGVGSALVYTPSVFSSRDELTSLARVAARYGGMYISHIRSESRRLEEAVDEIIDVARDTGARVEIYHLKAAGRDHWSKLPSVIAKIEAARAAGLSVTADMYTYTASATGLDASMPPWVQAGGYAAWSERLRRPDVRERVAREMRSGDGDWENNFAQVASADDILLIGFKSPSLKPLAGQTLGAIARARGRSPEETAMDLVVEDGSRVETVYFLMSEENLRREVVLPWVSFCSDADAPSPEGVFLRSSRHPRAYGSFARLLGRYVRDERLLPLEEAIRKLTSLPADNLRIARRGRLRPGYFADVVVFDPKTIRDEATYEAPHRFATGVRDVLVNGRIVLRNGELTGALPGRAVRGPGWQGQR